MTPGQGHLQQQQQQQQSGRRRHAPATGLRRQHIETAVITCAGCRLTAALALTGNLLDAAVVSLVYILSLLLEFGPVQLGSPYRLRRSASHGVAQGVLAVPSVLAALVAAAPADGWQPWLHGACAAAVAILGVVYLQSRSNALTNKKNDNMPAGSQGPVQSSSSFPVAVKPSGSAAVPSMLAAAVLLCSVVLAAHTQQQRQQHAWLSVPQQLLAVHTALAEQIAAAMQLLVWACLASASLHASLRLLPGCFSLGEAALMAHGATCLIITAAGALPHAALFVPGVVCSQLPHGMVAVVQHMGGCTAQAHSAAVSLQGLPAAVTLVLAAAVAACVLLRVLYGCTQQLKQQLRPSSLHSQQQVNGGSAGAANGIQQATGQHQCTASKQQLAAPACGSSNSSSAFSRAHASTSSRCSRAAAAAGNAAAAIAAAAGICAVLLWLCCAAAWTLLEFLPAEAGRLGVLLYWVGLLAATLPALKWLARVGSMPQIIVRKVYHLLAIGLFVPAFFWDLQLLSLSLAIAFAVLVLLEVLRCTRLPVLGQAVQDFMQAFVDDRDSGVIYITHFTLLLGLAVPMWLCLVMPRAQVLLDTCQQQGSTPSPALHLAPAGCPSGSHGLHEGTPSGVAAAAAYALSGRSRVGWSDTDSALLQVAGGLSGLVIIGVGDTAASFVGKLFGRVPVHAGSSKTVEGTLAGISASLGAWVVLLWAVQLLPGLSRLSWWLQLIGVTAGAGLMEAATSQLDNILLPLWYLPHLLLV